jgi:hypothetical protein
MVGKNIFIIENKKFLYSPQRDKGLSTSKKEIKNDGIGN